MATSYNNIGYIYSAQGDYSLALEYYQKALAIYKQAFGDTHPKVALSYHNIGYVYNALSDYALALNYYQQALDIRKQALGQEHPDTKDTQEKIETITQKMNEEK